MFSFYVFLLLACDDTVIALAIGQLEWQVTGCLDNHVARFIAILAFSGFDMEQGKKQEYLLCLVVLSPSTWLGMD